MRKCHEFRIIYYCRHQWAQHEYRYRRRDFAAMQSSVKLGILAARLYFVARRNRTSRLVIGVGREVINSGRMR